jgi:hypothetical protein
MPTLKRMEPKPRKPVGLVSRAISDANQASSVIKASTVEQSINRKNQKLTLDQVVSDGEGAGVSGVNQHQEVNLADRDYYFELVLIDSKGTRLQGDAKLRAGEQYTVRVSASLNAYSPIGLPTDLRLGQKPIRIKSEERLTLFVDGNPMEQSSGGASSGVIVFDLSADLNHWSIDSTFELQPPTSSDVVRIVLARADIHSLAAELKYDRYEPVPPAAQFVATFIPAVLPQHTAILHIDPDGTDQILFKGFRSDQPNRPLSPWSIERTCLKDKCKDKQNYLKTMRDRTHDLAVMDAGNVATWLEEVTKAFGDDCCIIILDKADSEIWWETFKLSGGRYLGAVATVVRWTEALYRKQALVLTTEDLSLEGRLAAYVEEDDWQATSNQRPVLTRLAPNPLHDPADVETELLQPPVGLVYLGYGGILVHDNQDEQDAITQLPEAYERAVTVSYAIAEGCVEPRPLFFVDSAFSGRILRKGQKLCGLAQETLTQVAVGYIGTLGPMDPAFAAKVAEQFLAAAEKGVRPAELLRQMRATAATRLVDKNIPSKDRLANFLQTFMYVYYGNPFMTVKVDA